MTLVAALAASALAFSMRDASGAASPPCAACVTWKATPGSAARLLDAPGPLAGLDVLIAIDADEGAAGTPNVARALEERGATVAVELPLDGALDPGVLAVARRVVLRLPPAAVADDLLLFRIRTRAIAVRAAAPAAVAGLSGPAELLLALATRGLEPYVSLLMPSSPTPLPLSVPAGLEWWAPAAAETLPALLEESRRAPGPRIVVALGDGDVPRARALARLAEVLPAGLTALSGVEVCAAGATGCEATLLHPRTLEAVRIVESPAVLTVRPGATRAVARPLESGSDVPLAIASGSVIDARGVAAPFVLRLAGWAGGEASFVSGVEVEAARTLTVAEIVAAHQATAARQSARVRDVIATGATVLTFQVPGLTAPMAVTAETVLYRRGSLVEIEQRDLRLNGVPVAVGEDGIPRLPLVQAERVATPPLSITLGEQYRYRLAGEEDRAGRRCYVVAFEPTHPGQPSFQGRAWIAKAGFALVRLEATQTGLRGAIVSSRQEDEMRALEVAGAEAWLPLRSEVEQVYEGPAHRTPVRRQLTFDRIEANPADFEARLEAAWASRSVMMRETEDGFRYLRRVAPTSSSPAGPAAAVSADGPAPVTPGGVPSGRALAGGASRVWSIAAGALLDPNIDRPLPFAGLSYLDFDVLGTGAQMSAFLAGPFVQAALTVPSVGGPNLQLHASAFASLARYNDRSFRAGIERYDENLRQRPLRASVSALRRLGERTRLRAAYDFDAVLLEPNDTTARDFRVPGSPVAHALRLGLEWERGAWSATAWGSASRRQHWREWGYPGDFSPEARTYERVGLSLARSFVLSRAVLARVEAGALAGRHLDRFSRFGFDAFDNRLRGYPSAGVRFDRGAVLRTAAAWTVARGLRLDAFLDAAVVRDPMEAPGARRHAGTGAAVEAALPGRVLLSVDWGFGWQARDRDGRRGTHVVRVTAFKVL